MCRLGLAQGDTIDLVGVGVGASAMLSSGGVLTVLSSGGSVVLHLDPAQSFAQDGVPSSALTVRVGARTDVSACRSPVVQAETFSTGYGKPLTLTPAQLLAGDSDPQGGTLTVTAVSGPGAT